jgi:ribose-phosphate pyrophosphokinase
VGFAFLEKFRSEGVVRGGAVVGSVRDRAVIILDDLIASGTTLARAAAACRESGARATYAAATHGVFSADAGRVLGGSAIDRIVILDTIPPHRLDADFLRDRVQVVDCAPLLATAIQRLHVGGSIVALTEP